MTNEICFSTGFVVAIVIAFVVIVIIGIRSEYKRVKRNNKGR